MKRSTRHRPARLVLAGLVFAASLAVCAAQTEETAEEAPKQKEEDIHLCLDRSGALVYQSEPCPPQAAPPPPERAAPAAPAPKPAVPDPVTPPAKPSVKPVKPPARPPAAKPALPPRDKIGRRQPYYAKPTAPAKRLRVDPLPNVDPRYATPERTWSTFSTALRAGDGPAARSCLTPGALEGLAPSVDSVIGGGPWSAFVDEAARVEPEGHTGPFWSMRIERAGVRPKWVFLVRGEHGEWKIAAL